MSTQINVAVDLGGLLAQNKQQQAANRQAAIEAQARADAAEEGEELRDAKIEQQIQDERNRQEEQPYTKDKPAANRFGGVVVGQGRYQLDLQSSTAADASKIPSIRFILPGLSPISFPILQRYVLPAGSHYFSSGLERNLDQLVFYEGSTDNPSDRPIGEETCGRVWDTTMPDNYLNAVYLVNGSFNRTYHTFTHDTVAAVLPAGGKKFVVAVLVRQSGITAALQYSSTDHRYSTVVSVNNASTPPVYRLTWHNETTINAPDAVYSRFSSTAFKCFMVRSTGATEISAPTTLRNKLTSYLPVRNWGGNFASINVAQYLNCNGTSQTNFYAGRGEPFELSFNSSAPPVPSLEVPYGITSYAAPEFATPGVFTVLENPASDAQYNGVNQNDIAAVKTAFLAGVATPNYGLQPIPRINPQTQQPTGYMVGIVKPPSNVQVPEDQVKPNRKAVFAYNGDFVWDWGRPTYCRQQLLSLGFTEEDLA